MENSFALGLLTVSGDVNEHDRHRIEPEEETACVVRKIFELRLSGLSYSIITWRLNSEDIPSPARYHYLKGDAKTEKYANLRWNIHTVKTILKNEVYLGHLVQGRKTSGFCDGRGQRVLPKSEWTVIRDSHTPIITQEVFDAVQAMEKKCHDDYYDRLSMCPNTGQNESVLVS